MQKRQFLDASMGSAGNPSNIRLEHVRPLWLHITEADKYLVLEDLETGDVLMPLIYMKEILEANYSRKLAALKYRQVRVPRRGALSQQEGLVYWQWAFESPHNVKQVVRKELGENKTPQGHLRLVLLPIVYNALVDRHHDVPPRGKLLFQALHSAMKRSSYWPLVRLPPMDVMERLDSAEAFTMQGNGEALPPLFGGPRSVDATALKYMFMFRDQDELEASKKARTTTAGGQTNDASSPAAPHSLQALLAAGQSQSGGPPPPLPGSSPAQLQQQDSGTGQTGTSSQPGGGTGIESMPSAANLAAVAPSTMTPELMAALLQKRGPGPLASNLAAGNIGGSGRVDAAIGQAIKAAVEAKMKDVDDEITLLKTSMVQMYSAAHRFALFAGMGQGNGDGQAAVAPGSQLAPPAVTFNRAAAVESEGGGGELNGPVMSLNGSVKVEAPVVM